MLKLASDRAFHLWHQFEREEISRKQLIRLTKPIQDEIWQRLEILRDGPDTTKKARGTAKDLLRQWASLWTYVHRDGAVPSNNHAYAACGISDIMPRPGLCRVGLSGWPGRSCTTGSYLSTCRHNQRPSRKASRASGASYRPGMTPSEVAWARALSLMPMSACK